MNKYFNINNVLLNPIIYSIIVLCVVFAGIQPAFTNWTSFRGNPELTGVTDSSLPDNLELLWIFQAGDMIESTATIQDDTVYVCASDGHLYAINADTGKSIWKYQAAAPCKSSPSIKDGVIYFGDGDGVFHAVDIATQERKWQYTTQGEIISSANFAGDSVLFGSYDGFLYCLNRMNGDLLWKYETEGYVHGTPGIWTEPDDGSGNELNFVVVTGCDSYLRVINIKTGKQVQQVNLGAYVGASPAILEDETNTLKVRAFCGTYGSEVVGVDLTSGDISWRYKHPQRQLPFFASAAVKQDMIIIGGRDKIVHALTPDRGEPLWTYTAKSKIESSPVIVGKRVFFGTTRGLFIALNITTGNQVWKYDTASSIVASPSVADGKIYIGTEDGILYCFGEK